MTINDSLLARLGASRLTGDLLVSFCQSLKDVLASAEGGAM